MRIISADREACLDYDRTALNIWHNSKDTSVYYLCGTMCRANYTLGKYRTKKQAVTEMLDIVNAASRGFESVFVESELDL